MNINDSEINSVFVFRMYLCSLYYQTCVICALSNASVCVCVTGEDGATQLRSRTDETFAGAADSSAETRSELLSHRAFTVCSIQSE